MRVRIDVSVFSTPTIALGNATGEIDVVGAPSANEPFPWPPAWVAEQPSFFAREQSRIWSVSDGESQVTVLLEGIVCTSVAEARDCAAFLQRCGLFFDTYEDASPELAA